MSHMVARLRGWTPISFRCEPEAVFEWADLRGHRFQRPFFSQTLEAWRSDLNTDTVHSGLSVLSSLDTEPSLDPAIIIAHPSRSGSTFLALLVAAMHEHSVLISEPEIVFQLLQANLHSPIEAPETVLRQIIRALGRKRFGTECHYVLKLSSRTSRFLPLFRLAFPKTPILWLQREPSEIVESNLRSPRLSLSGLEVETVTQRTLRDVSLAFLAANGFKDANFHILDYRALPLAAFTSVAALMGVEIGEEASSRMLRVSRSHSHSGAPYVRRAPNPLPKDVQEIVNKTLNPLYAGLAGRARL
jgi:hypothetical protein